MSRLHTCMCVCVDCATRDRGRHTAETENHTTAVRMKKHTRGSVPNRARTTTTVRVRDDYIQQHNTANKGLCNRGDYVCGVVA